MTLRDRIHDDAVTIESIGAWLDDLTHETRLAECMSLNKRDQARLFELCGAGRPIQLDDLIPPEVAPLKSVTHHGRNTLPMPFFAQKFQKRMCRPGDGTDRIFGYNESFLRYLIGPGYFVAHDTLGHGVWSERGALVVNYGLWPDGDVVPGWPWVIPNWLGLQALFLWPSRDFMRRASRHVSIGSAYWGSVQMGAYFVLCREPS